MFAEQWRRQPVAHRRIRKSYGIRDAFCGAYGRMLYLDDQTARARLRIVQCFRRRIDGGGRNVRLCELSQPRSCRGLLKQVLEQRDQDFTVLDSQRIRLKSFISADVILDFQRVNEPLPQCFRTYSDDKISIVAAAIHFIRHDVWMSIAPADWRYAGVQVAASYVGEPR